MQLESDRKDWDNYAHATLCSSPYHLSAWKSILATTYRHKAHYLMALRQRCIEDNYEYQGGYGQAQAMDRYEENKDQEIVGVLPFIQIKSWLFGSNLSSMPFCDSGGVLAADGSIERILIEEGLWIANTLRVPVLELRQYKPLGCLNDHEFIDETSQCGILRVKTVPSWSVSAMTDKNKVRMLADLPGDPDILMKSFKPKLRSQIRKPIKEGLVVKIGNIELVNDFYDVFAENMRDLGSPVHSKKFIVETVKAFSSAANVFVVYSNHKPLAGSVTIGFNDTLSNPWASSLRRHSHLAPNMLLYWSMLEFACQNCYRRFDFGRSTIGEGTYRFKAQWGARPEPLYWYRFYKTGGQDRSSQLDKDKMSKMIEYWKKLPVSVTKIIGPRIRKYISL